MNLLPVFHISEDGSEISPSNIIGFVNQCMNFKELYDNNLCFFDKL